MDFFILTDLIMNEKTSTECIIFIFINSAKTQSEVALCLGTSIVGIELEIQSF